MSKKQLFSVINKDSKGATLRNTDTRLEKYFLWEDLNKFFIKDGSNWLYTLDESNPYVQEADKLAQEMIKDVSQMMPYYLIIRKGNESLTDLLTFGEMTKTFCEKYEVTYIEFVGLFREHFKALFGVYPVMGDKSPLTIKGE